MIRRRIVATIIFFLNVQCVVHIPCHNILPIPVCYCSKSNAIHVAVGTALQRQALEKIPIVYVMCPERLSFLLLFCFGQLLCADVFYVTGLFLFVVVVVFSLFSAH